MQRYKLSPTWPKKVSESGRLNYHTIISSVADRRAIEDDTLFPTSPPLRHHDDNFSKEKKCRRHRQLLTKLYTPSGNKTQKQTLMKTPRQKPVWLSNNCYNSLLNNNLNPLSTHKLLDFKTMPTYQQNHPYMPLFLKKKFKHWKKNRILKAMTKS